MALFADWAKIAAQYKASWLDVAAEHWWRTGKHMMNPGWPTDLKDQLHAMIDANMVQHVVVTGTAAGTTELELRGFMPHQSQVDAWRNKMSVQQSPFSHIGSPVKISAKVKNTAIDGRGVTVSLDMLAQDIANLDINVLAQEVFRQLTNGLADEIKKQIVAKVYPKLEEKILDEADKQIRAQVKAAVAAKVDDFVEELLG